jgi:iron(III) transport system permease protein
MREYRRIAADWTLLAGLLAAVVFLAVAILWPLVRVLGTGVSAQALPILGRYFTSPVYLRIIVNTIELGVLVGLFGTALGFLFAFVQVRVNVPFKKFMNLMALVPIISPPFAIATSAIVLFGRSGIISYQLLGIRYNIYGINGLALVLVLSLFTVAYMNLAGMMRALDPALDEVATNLGANKWQIFRTVTLPMLIPGIGSSFLLLFVEAIADLSNPLVLGGDFTVLASRVYIAIIGEYDVLAGAVLSVILLVPSLTVFILQRYWASRQSVVSVTGRPSGRSQLITAPLAKWTLFAVTMFFSLLILIIYGTVFVGAFTQLLGIDDRLTLEHFMFVLFGYGSEAMTDTTTLSAIATPIAGLLGMIIAWLVVRKQFTGRAALDFGSMLGLAVPGTVIGIGYVLAFHSPVKIGGVTLLPPLHGGAALAGGAIALILAYVVRSVPASVRAGAASLQQIDPSIEEASISLGADNATTFRKVTLPLIRPALIAGLVFGFARSMTSISAIIFLTTPETKIMTAQILNEVDAGRFGNAFAYCVILILIVLTVIGVLNVFVGTSAGVERELGTSL